MTGKEKKKVMKEGKKFPQKHFTSVEFTLLAPEAMEVLLSGSFNSWDTHTLPMRKNREGVWKTAIDLAPGCYEYKFRADGVWVENISGVETTPNPFGTRNLVAWVK
jgi:1,4-alpha-glucan branching enzyme